MPDFDKAFGELIKKNTALHVIIENEVRLTPFGSITINIQIVDGKVVLSTCNIVKNRRYRYSAGKVI